MTTLDKIMEINPFNNQKSQKMPEKEGKVEIEKDMLVERTLELYRTEQIWNETIIDSVYDEMYVLNPPQIDILLQRILKETEKRPRYIDRGILGASRFITGLIQKSYDNGHNNFQLTTGGRLINCFQLKGKEDNRLKLTIKGNALNDTGTGSENCILSVEGNAGVNFGFRSKNSIFNLEGNTGGSCGQHSERCTYNIGGDVGGSCGKKSKKCRFDIKGNTGGYLGEWAENCRFDIKGNVGFYSGNWSQGNKYNIGGNTEDDFGNYSVECIFNIQGDINEHHFGWEANDCTFTSPNKETYEKMSKGSHTYTFTFKDKNLEKIQTTFLKENKVKYTGK